MSGPQPQRGQRQPGTANTGSQTVTTTEPSIQVPDPSSTATPSGPILRLRGAHAPGGPRVQWAESVVDNEGLGRKSSKVCCIYHAPRAVGESSSSESSSDSDSDSDSSSSGSDSGRARRRVGEHGHNHDHGHDHAEGCSHNHATAGGTRQARRGDQNKPRRRRKPSPNAYEKQPKPRSRPGDKGGSSGGQRSELKGTA